MYVLIVISMIGNGYFTAFQDFASSTACEAAKREMLKTIQAPPNLPKIVCVSKGE